MVLFYLKLLPSCGHESLKVCSAGISVLIEPVSMLGYILRLRKLESMLKQASIPDAKHPMLCSEGTRKKRLTAFFLCPQQESNLHLILRTDLLYPLSYEGIGLGHFIIFKPKNKAPSIEGARVVYFLRPTRDARVSLSKPTITCPSTSMTGTPI